MDSHHSYYDGSYKYTSWSPPIEVYKGFQIFERWDREGVRPGGPVPADFSLMVWDVVKNGLVYSQRAGLNGARQAIDEIDRPRVCADEYLEFLDALHESGENNMGMARIHLLGKFQMLSGNAAKTIQNYWSHKRHVNC